MTGVVKKLKSEVSGQKLVTTITGSEIGTFTLEQTKYKDFRETLTGDKNLQDTIKGTAGKSEG